MTQRRQVRLKVRRQDGPDRPETKRWEEFDARLAAADERHQRADGDPEAPEHRRAARRSTPVVWECVCLEEVCGSCTMVDQRQGAAVVHGARRSDRARTARPITLEPMTKFPLVRDLVVDRSRMFDDLKKVKAWIQLDGSHELGPGPRQSQENQEEAYPLSRCMTCGCCLEACPQINDALATSSGPRRSTRCASSTCTRAARCTRPSASTPLMGEGGVAGLRQGAELRRGVPEGDPAGRLDRRDVARHDEADALRLAAEGVRSGGPEPRARAGGSRVARHASLELRSGTPCTSPSCRRAHGRRGAIPRRRGRRQLLRRSVQLVGELVELGALRELLGLRLVTWIRLRPR